MEKTSLTKCKTAERSIEGMRVVPGVCTRVRCEHVWSRRETGKNFKNKTYSEVITSDFKSRNICLGEEGVRLQVPRL